jgi:hypothetical protein
MSIKQNIALSKHWLGFALKSKKLKIIINAMVSVALVWLHFFTVNRFDAIDAFVLKYFGKVGDFIVGFICSPVVLVIFLIDQFLRLLKNLTKTTHEDLKKLGLEELWDQYQTKHDNDKGNDSMNKFISKFYYVLFGAMDMFVGICMVLFMVEKNAFIDSVSWLNMMFNLSFCAIFFVALVSFIQNVVRYLKLCDW